MSDSHWAIGRNDPIPEELVTIANDRQIAIANARQASTDLTNELVNMNKAIDQYNIAHPDTPHNHVTPGSLDAAHYETTISRLLKATDDPVLTDHTIDLYDAAKARREALQIQTDVGELFGEKAGEYVGNSASAKQIIIESGRPSGTFDQVWWYVDEKKMVLYECKGPSAKPGTRDVVLPDGTTVTAEQGSTAYVWAILRSDPLLLDEILLNKELMELKSGLLDQSITVEQMVIRPNSVGQIKATSLTLDQAKLDVRGWLAEP